MQRPHTVYFDNNGAKARPPTRPTRRAKIQVVLPPVSQARMIKQKRRPIEAPKVRQPEIALNFSRFFLHFEAPRRSRDDRKCREVLKAWIPLLGPNITFTAMHRRVETPSGKTVPFVEVGIVGYDRPDLLSLVEKLKREIEEHLDGGRVLTSTCGPKRIRMRKSTEPASFTIAPAL